MNILGSNGMRNFLMGLAVLFSALSVACYAWYNLLPGDTVVHKPTSYAILRGLAINTIAGTRNIEFPSDHIILPLPIENNGAVGTELVDVRLNFEPGSVPPAGAARNSPIVYYMEGEYPDISYGTIEKEKYYTIKRSLHVKPHTLEVRTVLFHIAKWYDPNSANHKFQFVAGQEYRCVLSYTDLRKNLARTMEFWFTPPQALKQLAPQGFKYWDVWETKP